MAQPLRDRPSEADARIDGTAHETNPDMDVCVHIYIYIYPGWGGGLAVGFVSHYSLKAYQRSHFSVINISNNADGYSSKNAGALLLLLMAAMTGFTSLLAGSSSSYMGIHGQQVW